jgi:hypothetical protein
MPKNREYTGLMRTPPSMAWLIRQRAWLKGQIDQCEKQLGELPRRIVDLQQQLAALDAVIPRQEVKVDPKIIRGTKPKGPEMFPYGVASKSILRALREANGKPMFTLELAVQLLSDTGTSPGDVRMPKVMDLVRTRLGVFASNGLVLAHRTGNNRDHVAWSLIQDDEIEAEDAPAPLLRAA